MKDPFVRMELRDPPKHNKFYEVWVEPASPISGGFAGFVVNFRYGRIGTAGLIGTKTPKPVSSGTASVIFMEVRSEKTAKGYEVVSKADPDSAKKTLPLLTMPKIEQDLPKGDPKKKTKKPAKPKDDDKPYRSIII